MNAVEVRKLIGVRLSKTDAVADLVVTILGRVVSVLAVARRPVSWKGVLRSAVVSSER